LLEKETLDGAEVRAIVFPDGEPDYLKPKVEEEPFKFDSVETESAEAPAEPASAAAEETAAPAAEEKPEA
jgi:hypothetical protein